MSYLIFIKSGSVHTPGPQPVTASPELKIQASGETFSALTYVQHVFTATASAEPNKIQASGESMSVLDYALHLVAATASAEPNQIQATVSITALNYA